jgi:hypothetical protein
MTFGREPYHESYGSKVLGEAFQPSLPYYFRTFTPHRLAYQGSWLWSGVVDEEGNRYACLREWKTEYSLNVLISKLETDLNEVSSRLYKRLNMGMIRFEKEDERQLIRVDSPFAPDAFHITLRPQHFQWKDADGELDLEFKALGPALRYLCPGEKEDCLYMSEFCRVSGMLQGKKVKGFGGIDCAFGTPGVGWLQSKIYRLLEKYWIVWANRYDDQSLEYGICFDGEADFNLGFVVRDGVAKISECSLQMESFDDGFPKQAEVVLGEERYTFGTTARVSKIKGFMQWANGEMRQEGDGRKTLESFSWLEFFG